MRGRDGLRFGALFIGTIAIWPTAAASQQGESQSCAERLTQQLRRFSEKCLSDLVAYVASQPKMAAKIHGETEKFYVLIAQDGDGLRAEAVSKLNYPLLRDETTNALKQLGWLPPENESDNWRKRYGGDRIGNGAAAEDLAKALSAYGLRQGQAISLTVGTDISG
jgi:hypothetical protein